MPNKHAAVKDLRKNKKHAVLNAKIKTHIRSLTHQLTALLKEEGKKTEAVALARKLQQTLNKASKNHVFHANKANRRISTIYKQLAKIK